MDFQKYNIKEKKKKKKKKKQSQKLLKKDIDEVFFKNSLFLESNIRL